MELGRLLHNLIGASYRWFHPTIDAIFAKDISWTHRWRLLLLQPISILSYSIATAPYLFSKPFTVDYLPVAPGRSVRVLVFKSPSDIETNKLRPLHIDIHAGAFIGGIPEAGCKFSARLAKETGAVVICPSYRFAPKHPFPAAIDDIDAVVVYLRQHAADRYGVDPNLLTTSGASAGGNLAIATAQSVPGLVKASVTFYAAINLRLKPQEKPRPARFPKRDPMAFLLPLYDSYAGPVREDELNNPRLSPILAEVEELPWDMMLVVPAVDILVHEQLTFAERVKEDFAKDAEHAERRIETVYLEKGFHGFLELPSGIVTQELKDQAFVPAVKFIRDVHRKYDWRWS